MAKIHQGNPATTPAPAQPETPEPVAVAAKAARPQIEIPEKAKIPVKNHLCPGVVRGDYKGVPVNVTVPRNEDPPGIGSEIDVTFREVIAGHAVEAVYVPKTQG